MTIAAALSYGELAAMMPQCRRAIRLSARSAGAAVGISVRLDAVPGDPDGHDCGGRRGFRQVPRHFFPSIAASNWTWHIWKVPPIPVGPMVLGNMDVGLSTQNLVAIVIIVLLSVINIFGVKTGAMVQNIFTVAKTAALLGLILIGIAIGRNPQALAANFTDFWRNAGLGAQHAVQVGVGGPIVLVGTITILAVAQVGSLFSADAWNNVTFTAGEVKNPSRNLPLSLALGTGIVIALYIACNFVYLNALPLDGSPAGVSILERGIKYATEDRVGTAVMTQMFGTVGGTLMAIAIMISTFGCCNGLILAGARLLRHGQRRPVLSQASPNCIPSTRRRRFR